MERKPVRIIFDTDLGGDCDDAGALALIHRLCDNGEAELLAVTHCGNSEYYAGCIDSINRYFGREVPVGINFAAEPSRNPEGAYAAALCRNFPNRFPPEKHGSVNGPMDTLTLLRRTLADADDHSVILVATGNLASMERLVLSEADGISPLSGKQLIEQKLCRTILMGGRFFESWPMILFESGNPEHHVMTWEYNIRDSGYSAARTVFEEWIGELILSSYEIGAYIVTMKGYAAGAGEDDPVAMAYQIYTGDAGRCSWDHTAVLEAVRPGVYWNLHEFGKISVDKELVTHWERCAAGRHSYLLPKMDYEEIRRVIDGLLECRR